MQAPTCPAPTAIYVHLPFCERRCPYCDFPTYAGREGDIPDYVEAVICQIHSCPWSGTAIETIYFGGGTPSYVPADSLRKILDALAKSFRVSSAAEISVEANPASASAFAVERLRACGFTRISLGIQALDDASLHILGRLHTAEEARASLLAARRVGFASVSADLMFAVPGQSLETWVSHLREVVALGADHVSAYCLTVEHDTPFARMIGEGHLAPVAEDLAAAMYEATSDVLASLGLEQYEISNYARPGHQCRHNLVYWHNLPYLGFGAAATSYVDGIRYTSVRDPRVFIERVRSGRSVVAASEQLEAAQSLGETLMLASRLREGLDLGRLEERYGAELIGRVKPAMERLVAQGLMEPAAGHLRLTRKGLLLADSVAATLMAALD